MTGENEFLFYALIMGIFITFVYDLLRICRRVIPHGSFWISMEDLCFWIYCAMEVFLLMYHESDGTLRWFAVLGAMAGMLAYKKLISPFFVKYASLLINKLIDPMVKAIKWLFRPLVKGGARLKSAAGRVKNRAIGKNSHFKWFLKKKLTLIIKVFRMTL